MNRLDIRTSLRITAEKIKNGEATKLDNGIEGLLMDADQFIEDQAKDIASELNRANKYDELYQHAKRTIDDLQSQLYEIKMDKIILRRTVEYFLDNQ